MRGIRAALAAALVGACSADAGVPETAEQAPTTGFEPPVMTNATPPVAYPPALYEAKVEGTVILRLFADASGAIVPESTAVAEGSGNAALDSAALRGVASMRFAPARRDGVPVATTFLQPVHFRLPDRTGAPERP
jgi:protein TonB